MYILVPRINSSNVTVFENDKMAMIEIDRNGPLDGDIYVNITTVDGTALG